jgi:hypothetical protein
MPKNLTINEKLHLVIPILADDLETVVAYAHSAPISREVFDAHFMLIGRTFAALHTDGLGIVAGPRVAALMLNRVAAAQRDVEGAAALLNEIRRLTNVLIRTPQGWDQVAFQTVVDQGMLSDDDVSEVTNAVVFFIVTSAMQRRQDLKEMMDGAAKLWGARTSSLDFTGFSGSLATSTVAASTQTHQLPASSAPF